MNMKRLTRNLLAVVLAVVVFAGCDGILDIEPQQSISDEIALATPRGVETALIGAYDVMGNVNLWGGRTMLLPDLLADDGDVHWSGTFEQPRQFFAKALLTDNSFVAAQWIQAYRMINVTNNVLGALDVFEDADRRTAVEGEARLLRGMAYFQLVRLFGRAYDDGDPNSNLAVPLVTEPTRDITEEDQRARSTVAEVYDLVMSDLTTARGLLGETNVFFANTYVASAWLARAHLERREWAQAAAEADRVIQSGRFSLAPTFAEAFNRTQDIPEYVFSTQMSQQDGFHGINEFFGGSPIGRGDVDILDQHLERYEEGDDRGEFFYIDQDFGEPRTGKWRFGHNQGMNLPIIRLAEMYLIRAEGNFRAGTEVGAAPIDDINTIRERANASELDSITLQDIRDERIYELSFEGHRLFDVKRFREDVGNLTWDSPRLVLPVPQREMDANPALTQNPGYN
jgi:starch-binding outer membrane protein, SusD/RagB family